jgi:peptidoglycan/xylan/chitin deacetylase (PgdA/CDA1 family)
MAALHGLDLAALAEELILSWDELRALSENPLVDIGAHTHDHYALARLSSADIRDTVKRGLERIETELGVTPRHFAYPYGYEAAVDRRSVAALEGFGFDCAVTTRPGMLNESAARDPLALPRISLNGYFQSPTIIGQYLTGAPFPIYNWARRLKEQVTSRPNGARVSDADGAL